MKHLHQAGWFIRQINRQLDLNRTTVRRYVFAESFLVRIRRPKGRSMLTPYLAYFEKRYQARCHNAQQLWRELCHQGYPGLDSQLTKWLSRRRAEDVPLAKKQAFPERQLFNQPLVTPPEPSIELPFTQQLAWLLVRLVALLEESDRQILSYVCQDQIIDQVNKLAKEFVNMVRGRQVTVLDDWLIRCQHPPAALLRQFGLPLQQDYDAVRAVLSTG